jgi:hypothetical protein
MNVYAGILQPVPIDALPSDGLAFCHQLLVKKLVDQRRWTFETEVSCNESEDSPIVCSLCSAGGHNKKTLPT